MFAFIGLISFTAMITFLILGITSKIKKNGKAKKNFIISGVLFFVVSLTAALDPEPIETANTTSKVDKPKTESVKNESNTKKDEDKKQPKMVDSEAQAKKDAAELKKSLKKAAKPTLGDITSFEVNDDMGKNDGGKIVIVHVKQDGITKNTADFNTTTALAKVFKNKKVNEITYFWEATLVDVKGNESIGTVLKVQMSKENAKTINWDNFSHKNLEVVADQYNISPVLK